MQRVHLFLLGLTLALLLVGCAASPAEPSQPPAPAESTQPMETDGVPDEVVSLVEQYMNAYKNGTGESVDYMHFESEFIRSAYIDSGDKLIDYQIEDAEKINDDLYCFTLLMKSQSSVFQSGDEYQRVFNFAARIENEWYYINGVSNIPPAIQENLDVSKYTYTGENIVDPDDIIGKIEAE